MHTLPGAHVAEQIKDAGSVACFARERPRTPRCEVPRASSGHGGQALEGVQLLGPLDMNR